MISVLRTVCSFARSCYPGTDKEQRVLEKQHTKEENNILDPLKLNVPLQSMAWPKKKSIFVKKKKKYVIYKADINFQSLQTIKNWGKRKMGRLFNRI